MYLSHTIHHTVQKQVHFPVYLWFLVLVRSSSAPCLQRFAARCHGRLSGHNLVRAQAVPGHWLRPRSCSLGRRLGVDCVCGGAS